MTNGVVALGFFGVAFIGGWIEQIDSLAGVGAARTVGIAASLISPADSMWRLAVYYLEPAIMRGNQPGPLSELGPLAVASVPNVLMVWWTIGFTVLTLAYAVRTFNRRAL
jgi:Cu-processing system permease protein